MAKIVVTKSGDILSLVFGTENFKFDKCKVNVTTSHTVGLYPNNLGIYVNFFGCGRKEFMHGDIDSVGGVTTDTNDKLYDELVKML